MAGGKGEHGGGMRACVCVCSGCMSQQVYDAGMS